MLMRSLSVKCILIFRPNSNWTTLMPSGYMCHLKAAAGAFSLLLQLTHTAHFCQREAGHMDETTLLLIRRVCKSAQRVN